MMMAKVQPKAKTGTRTYVRPDAIIVVKREENNRLFRNPRLTFKTEPLESLASSIAQLGLIKPLLVKELPNGDYELVAGERRLRSIKSLIAKKEAVFDKDNQVINSADVVYEYIPVELVKPENDLEQLAYALAENLEAAPVPEWDLITLCVELENTKVNGEPKYTRQDMTRIFNRCEGWISQTLSLAELPSKALERMQTGKLSRTAAIQLLSVESSGIEDLLDKCEKNIETSIQLELQSVTKEIATEEMALLTSDLSAQLFSTSGNKLEANTARNKASSARKNLRVARQKLDKSQRNTNKSISADNINTTAEEMGIILEDKKKKARSPKTIREKIDQIRGILLNGVGATVSIGEGKKRVKRENVDILVTALEWASGESELLCPLECLPTKE